MTDLSAILSTARHLIYSYGIARVVKG